MASVDSSDDEPDYMSDEFLTKCVPKDVRPSLLYKPGDKRKHEVDKKKQETNEANKRWKQGKLDLRVQEQEAREAGLKKEIGSDNKGFQLLAKMGYKPGSSIGKNLHNEGQQTLKIPIPVELKSDRFGLGKKTKDQEQLKKSLERREELIKLSDPKQYRQRILALANQKVIEKDLKNSQSSCRILDTQNEITSPVEPWYWPKPEIVKKLVESDEEDDDDDPKKPSKDTRIIDESDQEEEVDESLNPIEQLEILTKYLREKYFYCIWCGTSYEDKEELDQSCPGNTKDDH